MTTQTCFLIECRTGCTCCQSDNHYRGPFSTKEIAEKAVARYREMKLLASQYSERGNYSIRPTSLEILPDGRMIINGDRVWKEGFQDEGLGLYDTFCDGDLYIDVDL